MNWYVVDIMGILCVEETNGDPIGVVVAGPFDTEHEANMDYVSLKAEEAAGSEIVGH